MLGFSKFREEPVDFRVVERLVDLDGSVTGDGCRDAAAAGFGVFGLLVAVGDGEDLFDHLFELAALEAYRGGVDGQSAGSEWLGFEAVALEFFGDLGEGDHLGGEEVDEQRHEEALTLG